MTKKDKKEYLEQLVANQGNQAGISIAPLLSAIIADCEDEINSTVEMAGGHYVLTLSKTPNSSLIIYRQTHEKVYNIGGNHYGGCRRLLGTTKPY